MSTWTGTLPEPQSRKPGWSVVVNEQLGVVTPEAVVLDFATANVGSRAVARGVDLALQLVLLLIVNYAIGIVAALLGAAGSTMSAVIAVVVSLIASFAILFGYPVIFESLWNGRTPGKAMVGLQVLTREGGPIRFRHAAVRTLIGVIEVLALGFIAVLSTALTRTNQRVGDMAAGTIVVRDRHAGGMSTTVSYPPPAGLDEYVRTLDVTSVTARQYALIRSFLLRVDQLRPAVRASMAVSLANPVAVAMRHEPPPGVTSEVFLVCVASAFQVRHGGPAGVWSAPGWSGYGLPKGWGFPPGYNGLTPMPPGGGWAAPPPSGWGQPPPQPGWAPPPAQPAPTGGGPPPGQGGWAPPPGPSGPSSGWDQSK